MKQAVDVKDLPKGGPYSHANIADNLVFVSGQTGQVQGKNTGFEEQFTNAMEKIKKILEASGTSIENVLKVNVYISSASFFQKLNELYSRYFNANPPARTTLVTAFVSPEVLVEVDVIATK